MRAEVIAVGSELLTPSKLDTNSLYIARELGQLGIPLVRKSVVGDDRELLCEEIRRAQACSDLVFLSGGLGPTLDDLTRDAASDATGRPLLMDESIVREIEARFRSFGRPMAEVNKRQAYLLKGAVKLDNPRGTAPGQWLQDGARVLVLLPGPPRELKPMFAEQCLPRLRAMTPSRPLHSWHGRVTGIGESDMEQRIGPLYSPCSTIATTILSSPGDVQIHLQGQHGGAVERLAGQISAELGDAVYSTDGRSLPEIVADLLRRTGLHLAVAESCTGGLLSGRLTDIPGSSEFFAGGIVSYSNGAKAAWLGVARDTLERFRAVSGQTAREMAERARARAVEALGEPAVGLSTTGYAGPSGGSSGDRPGTVYIGLADSAGSLVRRRQFGRGRKRVRTLTVLGALDLFRRRALGLKIP